MKRRKEMERSRVKMRRELLTDARTVATLTGQPAPKESPPPLPDGPRFTDALFESMLGSLPGASTYDDVFHAQHPVDTVEDPTRRRIEKFGSVLLAGIFGPPIGMPWRVSGSAAPCDPGAHEWQDLGVFHDMIRNYVLNRVKGEHKLGAKLCPRCWHAFLPSSTHPEAP